MLTLFSVEGLEARRRSASRPYLLLALLVALGALLSFFLFDFILIPIVISVCALAPFAFAWGARGNALADPGKSLASGRPLLSTSVGIHSLG